MTIASSFQDQKTMKLVESKLKRYQKMLSERENFLDQWQEVADYVTPRKNDYTIKRSPGQKRNQKVVDTTPITANQWLAGAMHSMLTNASVRFFELLMAKPELNDIARVKEWLSDTADRMFLVVNASNFQTEVHEIYIDLGAINTACLYIGEHPERVVHFNARSMQEITVDENHLGLIDTVYRCYKTSSRAVIQEFGEKNLPKPAFDFLQKNIDKDDLKMLHTVEPLNDPMNEENEKKAGHQFVSYYILENEKILISKSGFFEFPYAVTRWSKTTGEKYGRGPGLQMLPDIKMVNTMMETTIRGAQKTVDPPLMVMDDGVIGKVRLTPGGLTVVRQTVADQPIKPLITDARVDFGYQAVEDVRKRIREGFFVDQLRFGEMKHNTSATEIAQRTQDRLRLMGPVLGRQNFEFLRPVIERIFGIMRRRGMLAPPPPEIQGEAFDIRYSSLVAKAQRMSEGQNIMEAISVMSPLVQVKPEMMDLINGDAYAKHILDIYGVSPKILNSDKEVKQMRDARAEQMAKQQQMEEAQVGADVAQKAMMGTAQMKQAER